MQLQCHLVQRFRLFAGHYWRDDPNFNLDNHIHQYKLPGAGDHEQLEKFASDMLMRPLDFSRPLWCAKRLSLTFFVLGWLSNALRVAVFRCCCAGSSTWWRRRSLPVARCCSACITAWATALA